jgi:histidinol-phosphate aminotransferase
MNAALLTDSRSSSTAGPVAGPGADRTVPLLRECWRDLATYLGGSGRAALRRLDANEGPPPPAPLLAELLSEAAATTTLYPEYDELKRAAAAAWGVEETMVLPCGGGDEGIRLLTQAFCGPFDPLLVTPPTFPMLTVYGRLAGARVLEARLGADWRLDLDAVLAALPHAAMVALVSPNNPTGLTVPLEQVTAVLEVAGRRPVLLDETYAPFCSQDAAPMLAAHPNLLLLRTLSKSHGVPGLRCGFVLGDERVIRALESLRSPYNVSAVATVVGAGLLRRDTGVAARLAAAGAARRQLAAAATAAGVDVVPAEAHFCLLRLGARRAAAVAALAGSGVLVRAPESTPDYIRVSVSGEADSAAFLAAFLPWLAVNGDQQ